MKLSELRPCDVCSGPVQTVFYLVTISLAVVDVEKANRVLGLNQIYGGSAFELAEIMSPDPECVKILEEEMSEPPEKIFVCQDCATKDLNVLALMEKMNARS